MQEADPEQLPDSADTREQPAAVHVKQRWSALLTVPEWMSEVPADLQQSWYHLLDQPPSQRALLCLCAVRSQADGCTGL